MSTKDSKALVIEMTEKFWNTGDMEAIETYYSPDYRQHGPTDELDMAAFRATAKAYFAAFPDLHITTDELIAEGDRVVKRWTARCTHTGPFLGAPPTGNKLTIQGIEVFRVSGGKFVEVWSSMDVLGLLQGTGIIPAMDKAA